MFILPVDHVPARLLSGYQSVDLRHRRVQIQRKISSTQDAYDVICVRAHVSIWVARLNLSTRIPQRYEYVVVTHLFFSVNTDLTWLREGMYIFDSWNRTDFLCGELLCFCCRRNVSLIINNLKRFCVFHCCLLLIKIARSRPNRTAHDRTMSKCNVLHYYIEPTWLYVCLRDFLSPNSCYCLPPWHWNDCRVHANLFLVNADQWNLYIYARIPMPPLDTDRAKEKRSKIFTFPICHLEFF